MVSGFFLAFGLGYLAFGLWAGVFGLPFAWLGASLTTVGIAYLWNLPGLFGKRPDGSRRPLALVLLGPFLLLSFLAWMARRLRQEPCWNEVAPGLYLGRMAAPGELPPGAPLVVDLTVELTEPRCLRSKYRCLPTLDGRAPAFDECLVLARELSREPGPVFVHCAAGHGRSATLAAAVVLGRGLVATPEEAIALLEARRPEVVLTADQRVLLSRLTPALRSGRT